MKNIINSSYWLSFLSIFLILAVNSFIQIANGNGPVKTELIYDIDEIIWGMNQIDSNNLLISTREGSIIKFSLNEKVGTKIKHNLNIYEIGQGGLLDIKLHKKYIYVTYSLKIQNGTTTAIAKAPYLSKKTLQLDFKNIFIAYPTESSYRHYGSSLEFLDDQIYFTIGDRGNRNLAQKLDNHIGKVLRINLDGTSPENNPYYNNKHAMKEVFSYGHRNPQGIFINSKKEIYIIEHGPKGGDELNRVEKGKNYGWPEVSFGMEYGTNIPIGTKTNKPGMTLPLHYYVPSIAPSAIIQYSGKKYENFKDKFFIGALKLRHLNVFDLKTKKEERYLAKLNERIRDIIELDSGDILVSTDSGKIFKLSF